MVPKLATGIAITTVLILFTTSLTPHILKKKVEAQRNHYQAEQRGNVNLRAADNLLEGQLGHAASDNHQAAGTVTLPTIVTGRAMTSGV